MGTRRLAEVREIKRHNCVIGAVSRLGHGQVLVDDGFDVVAFEKEPTLGGVWAARRTSPGFLRCGKMAIIQGAAVVRSNQCEWTFVEYGEWLTLKVNEN